MSRSPYFQSELFDTVSKIYSNNGSEAVQQSMLYSQVAKHMGLLESDVSEKGFVHDGRSYNLFQRDIRLVQQRLKSKGILENVDRGQWRLTKYGREQLTEIREDVSCLAFSTDLGICLWGDARLITKAVIDDDIKLILTSPPYPHIKRAYGVYSDEKAYVDFILSVLDPLVKKMAPGAGLAINIGNDVFNRGEPTRSLYVERLALALHDDLGLFLVERLPWVTNKCPGPTHWAFKKRTMLRSGFEHVLCFTNNPQFIEWDNRRVLEAHNQKYLEWCRSGGEKSDWSNNTYSKKQGSYSGTTEEISRIPTNVLSIGNRRKEGNAVKLFARENGLSEHTATFPKALAEFLIKWMTSTKDLVVDPFGGTLTVAKAAEDLQRRWISTDKALEYLYQGGSRFSKKNTNQNIEWLP